MNIVFGGAFNPPSIAHLQMIKYFEKNDKVEHIIVLPVGDLYNKENLVDHSHRYNMISLMIEGLEKTTISRLELDKPFLGTYQSLMMLNEKYKDISYLIGADNLIDLENWIDFDELVKKFKFIVFQRNSIDCSETISKKYFNYKKRFNIVNKIMDISSSQIREDIHANKDLLLKKVYEYIIKYNLYSKE